MDFLRNYFVVLLALILVFVLNISFTLGDNKLTPNYDFEHYKVLNLRSPLVLSCNYSDPSSSGGSIRWEKNGAPFKSVSIDGRTRIEVLNDKVKFHRPSLDDVANYTCLYYPSNGTAKPSAKAEIEVVAKPYVKISPQLMFVEGEELKIECIVHGKPPPTVIWKFENTTYDKSMDRVKLQTSEAGVQNAVFVIEHAVKEDRGSYTCMAQNIASNNPNDPFISNTTTFVRIKDKFAALWPFLGICVEVVVLCAIIFVYEKKRNKAELEESDTDQSPEQKNTPDHGKDSVRQRK